MTTEGPRRAHIAWILVATCGSATMVAANTSVVTGAVPQIGLALHASQTSLQWIGDAYPLVLAALLLPCGALVDRYGRKRGLALGTAIMCGSMVWSAVCGSAGELIATRGLAGVGAALLFPGTLATITNVVPPERRGMAIAMWAGSFALGGGVGTMIAGSMIQYFWWGSAFVLSAGLVGALLLLILVVVPETRDPHHANIDPFGALLSCVAVGSVVLAMTDAPVRGWTSGITMGTFVVGVIASVNFLLWESTARSPMLDLRLFRRRSFSLGAAAIAVVFFSGFGWFFLTFQYETYVLGYGPLKVSLGLMAGAVTVIPGSALSTTVAKWLGRRAGVTLSLLIIVGAAVLMAEVGHLAAYVPVGLGFFLMGLGLGLGNGPPTEAIIESLPESEHGLASAVNDTAREFGAALGIAILGSAFDAGYRSRVGHLTAGLARPLAGAMRSSPAAGIDLVRQHGVASGDLSIVRAGVISGWGVAMWTMAGVTALGVISVGLRFPEKARPPDAEEQSAVSRTAATAGSR